MGTSTRNEFREGSNFKISLILTTRKLLSQSFNVAPLNEPGRRFGPPRRANICSVLLLADSDSRSAVMNP